MSDVNTIKGGEYELLAVSWDETTSKPGDPYTFKRHYKGDTVTLSEEDARRLVPVGAVAPKGQLALQQAELLRAQYVALLASLPDEVRAQLADTDPDKLAAATPDEVPIEERRVDTVGMTNPGDSPRVAEATVGEGDGGPENAEAEGQPVTATEATTRQRRAAR